MRPRRRSRTRPVSPPDPAAAGPERLAGRPARPPADDHRFRQTDRKYAHMHVLDTVRIPRVLLVEVLDRLADAAGTMEDLADGRPPLDDPQELIVDLRHLICELSLEIAAADLLI